MWMGGRAEGGVVRVAGVRNEKGGRGVGRSDEAPDFVVKEGCRSQGSQGSLG